MAYGPPQSVYTTQTPDTQFTGATAGADVVCAVAGRITGLKYYRHAAATIATKTMKLYTPAGAVLATATATGTGAGWKTATLGTPVDVTAGQTVRPQVDHAGDQAGRRAGATSITNGDLQMPTQYVGGVGGPADTVSSRFLYVDVIFEAGTADPTGGRPKVYAAGSWQTKPAKAYVGGAWTEKPLKRHNGTTWVPIT